MSQVDRQGSGQPGGVPAKKLRLDKANAKFAGVCAGLANYFGMDPMVMRLIFVLGALFGVGSFIIIYLVIWLLAD